MAKPEETSVYAPQAAYTQTPAEPVQEAASFQRSRALVTNQPTTNNTAQRTDHCKLGYGALHTLSATDNQICTAYKPLKCDTFLTEPNSKSVSTLFA